MICTRLLLQWRTQRCCRDSEQRSAEKKQNTCRGRPHAADEAAGTLKTRNRMRDGHARGSFGTVHVPVCCHIHASDAGHRSYTAVVIVP